MSSLPGHARITRKAVDLLAVDGGPVYRALRGAGIPTTVVARDILDVICLGHWADFGQCHHFMRRFDGQSEREAHDEAVHWIWRNAADAARLLSYQLSGTGTSAWTGSSGPVASQALGNALHATQDSFAWGHAEREESDGPLPGSITRIKRYAGHEKDGHEAADALWKGGIDGFSTTGWHAIGATRDLLHIVVEGAIASRGGRAAQLPQFARFRGTWLARSSSLSDARDLAFDLIDRHALGIRLGAHNLKTVSMDEEGLAKALVEAGTDMGLVHRVFERLREQYSSDSDDVAELYVERVRKQKGTLEAALRGNRDLRELLIRVMDEGWTSSGEQACIDYLKGLA